MAAEAEEARMVENAKRDGALEGMSAVLKKELRTEMTRLAAELERTKAQLDEERRASEESMDALRAADESLRKELRAAQAELVAAKEATVDVERIAELEKSESGLKKELQRLKAEYEEERSAWQKELADARAAVEAEAEAKANGLKEELACMAARAVAETKVRELEELQEEMEEELARINTQLEEEHRAWEEGMDALRNTRWEADELHSDVTQLKMELAVAKAALVAERNSREETRAGLEVAGGKADGMWLGVGRLEKEPVDAPNDADQLLDATYKYLMRSGRLGGQPGAGSSDEATSKVISASAIPA